jgi:hypothetical protein
MNASPNSALSIRTPGGRIEISGLSGCKRVEKYFPVLMTLFLNGADLENNGDECTMHSNPKSKAVFFNISFLK